MSTWTTFRDTIITKLLSLLGLKTEKHSEQEPTVDNLDEVDFSNLSWCWGGFNGALAALNRACVIANLKVDKNKMTYNWVNGSCQSLAGASSASDYSQSLACLFVLNNGQWRGGKFDWISTSRTTRGFENIHDGYNGWDANVFADAEAYAFVIASRDGKHRTNVVMSR